MDEAQKLYWDTYFENFSTEKLLEQYSSPIRAYKDDLIEGVILDIGCGQSAVLLDFFDSDRKIIAIDEEQFQLDYLKNRVETLENANIENWTFKQMKFQDNDLPNEEYALVILSNFLHFFTLDKCNNLVIKISELCKEGTLIYVIVHSTKFYRNDPSNPKNNDCLLYTSNSFCKIPE